MKRRVTIVDLVKAHNRQKALSEAETEQRRAAGRHSHSHDSHSPGHTFSIEAHGGMTKDTGIMTHWRGAVDAIVSQQTGASIEEIDKIIGRERLSRWYQAGEPVWMAVTSVRGAIQAARPQIAADKSNAAMRRMIALGRNQGDQ